MTYRASIEATSRLLEAIRDYMTEAVRLNHPAVHARMTEMGMRIPNSIAGLILDDICAEVCTAIDDENTDTVLDEFEYDVNNRWFARHLSGGMALEWFNESIADTDYEGEVYQTAFGLLDDGEWFDDDHPEPHVFGSMRDALRWVMRVHATQHVRIFGEYVSESDTELRNEGPDAIVYPPHSDGNDSDRWLLRDFDMCRRRINEDGTLSPWARTWRDLMDEIDPDATVPDEILALLQ